GNISSILQGSVLISGTSTTSATLLATGSLAGTISGTTTTSGALIGAGQLSGTISGTSTTSGTLLDVEALLPVSRYLINEASSGQEPDAVVDSRPDPTNLTITYVGSIPSYTEIDSGKGLNFTSQSSPQGAGAYSVALKSGVKVYDEIEGS